MPDTADTAETAEAAQTAETTVADWIGAALARDAGLRTVFGVTGPGNRPLRDALARHGARFVEATHEGAAAARADAYARVSGELGVLSLRSGAGLTTALTALAEAARSRTPLLVLATEEDRSQTIDQPGLAAAVGVLPDRVSAASTARNDLRRAYRTALLERRTVLLSLPPDLPHQPLSDVPLEPVRIWPRLVPAPETAARVADALQAAGRTVFLAGRGARGARQELTALAERSGALLATSTAARGLFHGNPACLDLSGALATPLAAELIGAADLVIAWGCALSGWTTGHGRQLSRSATVIQVDASPAALGAGHRVDLGIPSDAATAARAVTAELDRRGPQRTGYRSPAVLRRIAEAHRTAAGIAAATEPGRVDPRRLTIALDSRLPAARTVIADAERYLGYPAVFLGVPDEHGFLFAPAAEASGLGLARARGAALARPERLTVAALGAPGFLAGAPELASSPAGAGLLVLVYDDQDDSDLTRIARGYGADALTVRDLAGLDLVSDWLDGDRARPLLVDAKVTRAHRAWWRDTARP